MDNTKTITLAFCLSTGPGYGLGNLLRCLALYRAFGKMANAYFVTPKGNVPENLKLDNIPVIDPEDADDYISKSDILVFDHQGPIDAKAELAHIKNIANGIPVIAFDYFFLNEENVDVFINLSNHFEIPFEGKNNIKYYRGVEYAIIRPEFHQFRNFDSNKKGPPISILVTFGGEDKRNWTTHVIEWMKVHIDFPLTINIIIGPLFKHYSKFNHTLSTMKTHTCNIHNLSNNIAELMSANDIVFCGGGTTILEAAYLGKTVIALPQNEMERKFLSEFEDAGYLTQGLESQFLSGYPAIGKSMFYDEEVRLEKKCIAQKIVDGKGVERIQDIIYSLINNCD